MVFDELDQEEKSEIHYLKPTRKNLDPLLGMNRKQTLLSIIIYAISIIIAYFVLSRYFLTENNLHYWWYFSFFIGIGAFIDQLIHPDENSKTGYFVLLIIYYIIYKFVVFSLLLYYIFLYIDYDYELHYFEEILPGMTLFLFWAIGQKVGYYIENKKLISQLNQRGPMSLNDIDRLKIFLYQVKRRSFLRMLIQRDKAKFMYVPSNPWKADPKQIQIDCKLVSLNMAKFLKFLKLTNLPESKYIKFSLITEIDFSKNKIKNFSTSIFQIFPNVTKIDLSKNKIKNISIDIETEMMKYFDGNVVINFDGNPVFA